MSSKLIYLNPLSSEWQDYLPNSFISGGNLYVGLTPTNCTLLGWQTSAEIVVDDDYAHVTNEEFTLKIGNLTDEANQRPSISDLSTIFDLSTNETISAIIVLTSDYIDYSDVVTLNTQYYDLMKHKNGVVFTTDLAQKFIDAANANGYITSGDLTAGNDKEHDVKFIEASSNFMQAATANEQIDLISSSFIKKTDLNDTYVKISDLSAYITKEHANTNYITTEDFSSTYQYEQDASQTYVESEFLTLFGESMTTSIPAVAIPIVSTTEATVSVKPSTTIKWIPTEQSSLIVLSRDSEWDSVQTVRKTATLTITYPANSLLKLDHILTNDTLAPGGKYECTLSNMVDCPEYLQLTIENDISNEIHE